MGNAHGTGGVMIDPEIAVRDRRRLDALLQTRLLDTPEEEAFNRLTRLAARLIDVPTTFISLVDEKRDFYKSCFGFGEPLSRTRQIEGRTFCHYALVSSGPLLIPDTMANPVFAEVPTVQSLGVRAYAGIPLIMEDGHAIGSFCAIDFKPREWSDFDVEVLTEMAAAALREIKLRGAVTEAQTQARSAQEAARSREELLAVVAHDLRTPLNFIKLAAHAVAESDTGPENRDLLERMEGAVDSMSLLIEDLLQVSKLESGQLSIAPKPIAAEMLVKDAVAMLKPLAQRHEMTLEVRTSPDLPKVQADYERILRVFSNLIVNAIKFSLTHCNITIAAHRAGKMVRFSVIDCGTGIAAEHIPLLFDRFWQANPRDRRGAGLGLAIAKALVTAHGGTIGVESSPGKGSEFWFELPAA